VGLESFLEKPFIPCHLTRKKKGSENFMESIQKRIRELPPELQREIEDFVEFLTERKIKKSRNRPKFNWAGALKGLSNQYTSVELQHKISEWRSGAR
jgi:hypothetical protein